MEIGEISWFVAILCTVSLENRKTIIVQFRKEWTLSELYHVINKLDGKIILVMRNEKLINLMGKGGGGEGGTLIYLSVLVL